MAEIEQLKLGEDPEFGGHSSLLAPIMRRRGDGDVVTCAGNADRDRIRQRFPLHKP